MGAKDGMGHMIPDDIRALVNQLEILATNVEQMASAPQLVHFPTVLADAKRAREVAEGVWRMYGRGV